MQEDKTVALLKEALLMERQGYALYHEVAQKTESPAVKHFFEIMAAEEEDHIQVLSAQFDSYQKQKRLQPVDANDRARPDGKSAELSQEIKDEVSAASYEAAAIAAAMGLEKRAIQIYGDRAARSDDPDEVALCKWLVDWEKQHLAILMKIHAELVQSVWNDRNFWPY